MVQPFIKWAGGKSQLVEKFRKFYPDKFNGYIELFVGSGAVFFDLYNLGLLKGKRLFLIDSNKDLINLYQIVKNSVHDLINELKKEEYRYTKENYYFVRRKYNEERLRHKNILTIEMPKRIQLAAQMLYLNKTCFNGLYRLNRKGEFNVPFGQYKNPTILNEERLKAVSSALKSVEILCEDFEFAKEIAQRDDFIYIDPPYFPLSKTSNFTTYTESPFLEKEQTRLRDCYNELSIRGCKLMQSNSDTKFIRKLYKGYKIITVNARRSISAKSDDRRMISEVLILNY